MRYGILLLLITTSTFGATADLEVSIVAPKTADADYLIAWTAHVTNKGPDAAVHVHITTAASFVNGTDCYGPQDARVEPHASTDLSCVSYTLHQNGVAVV